MKLLLLLCLVVGTVYSGYGYGYNSERETVNGHLDFTHSSKSLNDYYPDLTSVIELPVLRYKYDWRQDGEEESLVIPLYDCTAEACNQCADGETALIVEVLDWAVVCQELPFHVSMVDQRSIGSDNDNSDEETGPLIQQSTGELTGALASSSSTAVLAGLQAQNKAYDPEEAEEGGPTGRSLIGSVSTTAASTTTAQTTVAPTTVAPTTILPDPKSQESDSGTEAPAAAPTTTTTTTSTTTTTTEAPVEATEPTVVEAAIEPADEEKVEALDSNEATTEASTTASSTTEAADTEDEPESDVGLQDDEYTLKAKEDDKTEEDSGQDSDEKEDSEQDSDEEPLFEDKESRTEEDSEEPDQIHLQTGIKSDEAAGWRAKYFTILGFFICFFIAFVIIIVFVIIKMKKKRAAPPTMIGATTGNVSPGPALERSFHTGDEHEPLTPAVPAGASTFKFDGTKSHTPLPR